ncbi:MAG: exosome complex protein Rrp42 [Candidatus Diapherotrites archaeon]|nr:exosome complex protein Rrp42 [Candidatus Diapherotrites archaeon]
MSSEDIKWEVKSDYIHNLAAKGLRHDGRKLDEYREIVVKPNYIENALGSSLVKIGGTQVLAGVSMGVGSPYPDTPNEGALMTGCELVPLASPTFESGPPRPEAIEVARVVDRGIRESHAIDMSSLCIEEGETVWLVMLDLHVLDYAGNLFDASTLAATSALLNTRMPKYEDGKIIRESNKKLPVNKKPVECTFAKIGDTIMLDPILEEEKTMDARITFATLEKNTLCAAQKGGFGSFKEKEVMDALDIAFKKGKELRKYL